MEQKISFWLAVLVNINIVIGAGFFLSVQKISIASGPLAPLAWLLCGLLLLPLVNALAQLAQKYPRAGGIYIFSRDILGETWGMTSGWAYYVGTAAANAAVGHALTEATVALCGLGPLLVHHHVPMLVCDGVMIVIFALFSLRNIDFLERAQLLFTGLKLLPITIMLIGLPVLFSSQNLIAAPIHFGSLMPQLPLVLFSFIGIEACCSVMDKIENSKKDAARLIFVSFAGIVSVYAVLQLMTLGIHGTAVIDPFLSLPGMLFAHSGLIAALSYIIHIGLLASFLAGFYGVFYFNNWNLYTMANETKIKQVALLTKMNKAQVPWIAVLVQAALIIGFLAIADDVGTLYVMAGVGTVLSYLFTAVSFFAWKRSFAGILAVASCGLFLYVCGKDLFESGLLSALPFYVILLFGIGGYWLCKKSKKYENMEA
jgi:amino acid transporter